MIEDRLAAFVGKCFGGQTVLVPNRLAQDTVDKSMKPLGDFRSLAAGNGLVDRGRFRNPFQKKELVQSDCKRERLSPSSSTAFSCR